MFFNAIVAAASFAYSLWLFLAVLLLDSAALLWSRGAQTGAKDPAELLRSDRFVALLRCGVFTMCAVVASMLDLIVKHNTYGIGLLSVQLLSIEFIAFTTACGAWYFVNTELARRKFAPWLYMRFLLDAHARGVLRCSGGVYQFRHTYLQEYLARDFLKTNGPLQNGSIFETKLIALRSRAGRQDSDAALIRLREIAARAAVAEPVSKELIVEARQQIVAILLSQRDYLGARKELIDIRRSGLDVDVKLHHRSWLLYIQIWRQSGDLRVARRAMAVFCILLQDEANGRDFFSANKARELLRDLYEK